MDKFYDKETIQEFQVKIVGAFEHMLELGKFKETTNEITEKVVGCRSRKQIVNVPLVIAV